MMYLKCNNMSCVSTANMKKETLIEKKYNGRSSPRSVNPSCTGFLALICRLLFYRPIWNEENQQQQNVRFIFVHFSAWHFAGSDLLWAGIAIRLFQAMQMSFGKLQIVLYRVAQHDEEQEVVKKVCESSQFFAVIKVYSLPVSVCGCTLVQVCFKLNAHNDNDHMMMCSRCIALV